MSNQNDGYIDDGWVVCSCCGKTIPNDAKHNVSFGQVPYPHDNGVGMCKRCDKDSIRMFCEARIPVIEKALTPEQMKLWKGLSKEKQYNFVLKAVKKGWLSW